MLKLYVCTWSLLTVTVKGAPCIVGVTLTGETLQLGGDPEPQLKFTALL